MHARAVNVMYAGALDIIAKSGPARMKVHIPGGQDVLPVQNRRGARKICLP